MKTSGGDAVTRPAHIGAYDGTFHDHGEPVSDWFITQGQMTICGNFAVEESTSSLKTYYWEIYHLMGDPSLMIYYSVPPTLTATYANPLMIGMTSLAVATEPYAYIALSVGWPMPPEPQHSISPL
jgi:hypothetical protein